MKQFRKFTIIILYLFILFVPFFIVDRTVFADVAISLKNFQKELNKCQSLKSCKKKHKEFLGVTQLYGFLIFDNSWNPLDWDIILLGKIDNKYPSLYTEDFIIALRNTWKHYSKFKLNSIIYTPPGCSIDSNPATIQKLQKIGENLNNSNNYKSEIYEKWHLVCKEPQTVRVMGVPFNSHFAKIMVDADYDMKKIVDGSSQVFTKNFKSLTELAIEVSKDKFYNNQKNDKNSPSLSMNRFWFYPGNFIFSKAKKYKLFILKKCQIKLLTEEEYVQKDGKTQGSGRPNDLANKFALSFTQNYDRIAKQYDIFMQLKNLYKFVAISKVINDNIGSFLSYLYLNTLLNKIEIDITKVQKFLPGRSNIEEVKWRKNVYNGYKELKLSLPTCGGVSMNLKDRDFEIIENKSEELIVIKENILQSKPNTDAIIWEYKL